MVAGEGSDSDAPERAASTTDADGADTAALAGHIRFEAVRLDVGTADERVVLSIADDGIGIPASDAARVFDRGFTGENGRRYGKSTGMGLYLCRQLCKKMGLAIALDSEEGRGTCIRLTFPENRMYTP